MRMRRGVVLSLVVAFASGLLIAPTPANARAAATLRVEYTFDTVTDGVVDDLSGRDHPLTLQGNYAETEGPTSPAVAFSPISRGSTPHRSDLNPGGRQFAMTTVFRLAGDLDPLADSPNVAQKGLFNDSGQWKMQVTPQIAAVQCRMKGTLRAVLITSSVTGVDDGQWHTATCWRTRGKVGVTVDGVDDVIRKSVGDIKNRRAMFVGAKSLTSGTDQFPGDIDYVAVAKGRGAAKLSRQALTGP